MSEKFDDKEKSFHRAILVIDVQEEYFSKPLEIQFPPRKITEMNIIAAVDLAHERNVPIALIQHQYPEGSPLFAEGSHGWRNRDAIEKRRKATWKHSFKNVGDALADDSLVQWLRNNNIDTLTLIGYMTNNCILATAASAKTLGFNVEILSDATGAIHIKNSAGQADAQQIHETLMVVLNSNWAAVGTFEEWRDAVTQGKTLQGGNLLSSAVEGEQEFGAWES